MKDFRTVRQISEIELIVHKSRFIGQCYPIEDERDALAILERVRKQYWDATHHCYAYASGDSGQAARFSDDGEPSGTAGLPMMEVLRKNGLTKLLCVVTRYFGGVLLGAGGLVRAYSRAAADAVRAAGCVEMRVCTQFVCAVPYPLWGRVEPFCREHALVDDIDFAEAVTVRLAVPSKDAAQFSERLSELTVGRVVASPAGMAQRAFDVEPTSEKE